MNDLTVMHDMIRKWLNAAYPHRTIESSLLKLEEEFEELKSNPAGEIADMFIVMLDIADILKVDVADAVITKMKINLERQWRIDGSTGLMHHIKKGGDDDVGNGHQ